MSNDDDIERLIQRHQAETYKAPRHRVAQWHAAIDEAGNLERGRSQAETHSLRPRRGLLFAAAIAATLTVGIAIGLLLSPPVVDETPILANISEAPAAIPAAFSRGLQYHLRESRKQLVDINAQADSTLLVLDIIEQNRMFEIAAENNDAHNVARVLRAFEPILLQLAADDIAPQDADALRKQLSFELNVMLTKLARESSDQGHTT